ncbi:hypothetical protein MBLNU230_g3166t1 [Neophaeotheca triangularis]
MFLLHQCFGRRKPASLPEISPPLQRHSPVPIEDALNATNQHPKEVVDGRIQYMSDLHLEKFREYSKAVIPVAAPCLILVGDIGRLCDADMLEFLRATCTMNGRRRVLFIPGNHEYFRTSRSHAIRAATKLQLELGPLGFEWMDRKRVHLDGGNIIVLGCTLHSHIPESASEHVGLHVMDFQLIGDWDVEDHNLEHKKDCTWLQQQVAEISTSMTNARIVIATHFPPMCHDASEADNKKFFYGRHTIDAFLEWEGNDKVTHWISGHTHENHDFLRGSTRFISNHRMLRDDGYSFDPMATIL